MLTWWRDLDSILRGEATRLSALRRGTIEVPIGGLTFVLIVLAMTYGACMGTFGIFSGTAGAWNQWLASTLKVPALFILTLAVTFPSLYVFNTLMGSRLAMLSVLRLLLAALSVTVAVLASLGPIVAFFSASTTSHPFMILFNFLIFAFASLLGTAFLGQTLHRLSLILGEASRMPSDLEGFEPKEAETLKPVVGALQPVDERVLSKHVKSVFRCWIIVYSLVGAQMAWVLRPFIGNPKIPFTWFRPRSGNVFQGLWDALWRLGS